MSEMILRIGRRVRYFRQHMGLSQEKLAERSGISGKYVGDLERGEANVSIQVLERIACGLGVTVMELLDNNHEADKERLVEEIQGFLKKADEGQIQSLYRLMKTLQ